MGYSQQELIKILGEKRANEIFIKVFEQKQKKNKYHAVKTNGYDSRKESNRANTLKFLQEAGKIENLMKQVRFELQPAFEYNGEKIRRIDYIADFVYKKDGKTIVEDVKGLKTDVYKLKKKLFLKKFGKKFLFLET